MDWSVEQRYRRLEDASKKELLDLQEKVNACKWRQTYHIQPNTGLLNDPNGFSYFNGEYHLFYQWFPFGPVHGLKYWYHMKSKNLVQWEDAGIGIAPDTKFESHGAFSGSGFVYNDMLYLMYTGNTRDKNWVRHPYQLIATMDKQGTLSKKQEPVIQQVPDGYTAHFRDPKVWKDGAFFYCVIGAQRKNETGCIVLYRSSDMLEWSFLGELKTELNEFGYMWECPDYFELNDKGVLVFSPQGINVDGENYRNIYQSGYLIGEKLDMESREFAHQSFYELDRGFDFYAPQTTMDDKGRRILIGWMGLPEIAYPTDKNGWAHCLTIARELQIKNGRLIQKPLLEQSLLRKREVTIHDQLVNETKSYEGFSGCTYEMVTEFTEIEGRQVGLEIRASETEKTVILYDTKEKTVIFDRSQSGESFAEEYGTKRSCSMDGRKINFHVFVDISSVELFINDGEEVFTSRIFPKESSNKINFFINEGSVTLHSTLWQLENK